MFEFGRSPLGQAVRGVVVSGFVGSFRFTLDNKGRMNVPAPFRKSLPKKAKDTFVVLRGLEGCLFLYPLHNWAAFQEKLEKLQVTKRMSRLFVRTLLRDATQVVCDAQGRIPLTEAQRAHASITSQVLITGALERIEIWDPGAYETYFAKQEMSPEDIAENVLFDQKPEIYVLNRK